METWIKAILSSDQAGFTLLTGVFLFGILSVFTCACNFSVIGMVAGYSGAMGATVKTKGVILNALFFLAGIVISMAAIGCIIGYASELISISFGNYWKIAAGAISIFFGLLTIDVVPFKIPGFTVSPSSKKNGILSSVIYGFTIGGLTLTFSSCCNPVFPVIVAVSFVKGSFLWGLMLMLAYAFGYGITIAIIVIAIGFGFGKTSRTFTKAGKVLKYAGGIIMIMIGFYLLITI